MSYTGEEEYMEDAASQDDGSIKQRLRSARRAPEARSEGRRTPICAPSDAADGRDGTASAFRPAVSLNALFTRRSNDPTPTRMEGGQSQAPSQTGDLGEENNFQEGAVSADGGGGNPTSEDLRAGARIRTPHDHKLSYHKVGRSIWLRDEEAGRPTQFFKLAPNEVPYGVMVMRGLPDVDAGVYLEDEEEEEPPANNTNQARDEDGEVMRLINRPMPQLPRVVSGVTSHAKHNSQPGSGTTGKANEQENGGGDAAAKGEINDLMGALRSEMKDTVREAMRVDAESRRVAAENDRLKRQLQQTNVGHGDAPHPSVAAINTHPRETTQLVGNHEKERIKAREELERERIEVLEKIADRVAAATKPDARPATEPASQGGAPYFIQKSELPKFDGTHFNIFIDIFEQHARFRRWSESEKMAHFLSCVEGKPRIYLDADDGELLEYEDVKRRLEERYGCHASAFEIKQKIRSMKRLPGETMEDFADRLQSTAQRARLEKEDKQELFYRAFLDASADTPKLQLFIEHRHKKNRQARLPDLLRWVREYRERSPERIDSSSRGFNACLSLDKRKGPLTHQDMNVTEDLMEQKQLVTEERKEREEKKDKISTKELTYALGEIEFLKKVMRANRLQDDLSNKLRQLGQDHAFQEPMGEPLSEADLERIRNSHYFKQAQDGYRGGRGGYRGGRGGYRGYNRRPYGDYGNRSVGTHTAEGEDEYDESIADGEDNQE